MSGFICCFYCAAYRDCFYGDHFAAAHSHFLFHPLRLDQPAYRLQCHFKEGNNKICFIPFLSRAVYSVIGWYDLASNRRGKILQVLRSFHLKFLVHAAHKFFAVPAMSRRHNSHYRLCSHDRNRFVNFLPHCHTVTLSQSHVT